MEFIMKLKRELVDENIVEVFAGVELFAGVKVSTTMNKGWLLLKVTYEEANVNQLSNQLDVLFKDYFQHSEYIGMRINDMPYVATSDNKNVKAIMQKLLK